MNTFSRICVVVAAAASLAFMSFAGAMRSGNNWAAEAQSLAPEYVLTINRGEQGTEYSMAHRSGGNVKTSKNLADVVVAARQKQVSDAQKQLQTLRDEAAKLPPQIEEALKAIVADEAGLKVRETAMEQQLAEVREETEQVNRQVIDKANEAQQIRSEGQERREEAYLRHNQLELLRNDLFAAKVQHQHLVEEELRLKELLQRLVRRRQQLENQLSGRPAGYEEASLPQPQQNTSVANGR